MYILYYVTFLIILQALLVIVIQKINDVSKNKVSETVDLLLLNQFYIYMKQFKKHYGDGEYLMRKQSFEESLREISRLNGLHGSEVFGLTKFSDMSKEEFRRTILSGPFVGGCVRIHRSECPIPHLQNKSSSMYLDMAIPLRFDWRDYGVVGKVQNQKQCNGCWAFSIVGVMESMAAIRGKGFTELSIQELIDCSTFNNGCQGGNVGYALDFLCLHDYPIVTTKEYPLKLVTQDCKIPEEHKFKGKRIAEFSSDCYVNEKSILALIAKHGPVIAVVNATPWMNYIDGIIQTSCQGLWEQLNHVVQIVGYDLSGEIPYYIVRNSWGKDFGNNGYVKLEIFNNVCGVASNIAYFTVK